MISAYTNWHFWMFLESDDKPPIGMGWRLVKEVETYEECDEILKEDIDSARWWQLSYVPRQMFRYHHNRAFTMWTAHFWQNEAHLMIMRDIGRQGGEYCPNPEFPYKHLYLLHYSTRAVMPYVTIRIHDGTAIYTGDKLAIFPTR